MIAVIDYGVGNIGSVLNALKKLGYHAKLTNDKNEILNSNIVVLPGVGAFDDAYNSLKSLGLDDVIKELVKIKKPIIAICVGLQLLCDGSNENGFHEGLGIFKGILKRFDFNNLKHVHMGYNTICVKDDTSILKEFDNEYFYFIHSYYLDINSNTLASTNYGINYTSILQKDHIYAFQFHPEKSGEVGLKLLRKVIEHENNTSN